MGFFNRQEKEEAAAKQDRYFRKVMDMYRKYDIFPYINPDEEVLNQRIEDIATGKIPKIPQEYMTQNEDGYILGELILLDWLNQRSSETNDYPDYFEFELGINPEEVTMELLNDDCLDILQDVGIFNFWTIEELNAFAREYDLPEGSNHAEMIALFQAEFSPEFLQDIIGLGNYTLMERGTELLAKYQQEISNFKENT